MRINSAAPKFGLIAGGLTVLYLVIFYFIGKRLMLSNGVAWGVVVIYITFMVMACRRDRELSDDYGFRRALRSAFVVYVIANAFYWLTQFLLFNVFDPSLAGIQEQLDVERAQWMAQYMPEDKGREMIQQVREQEFTLTVSNTLLSYSWGLIGGFFVSVVVGMVYKK